jgi:outer membrane protein assembly factor BamD
MRRQLRIIAIIIFLGLFWQPVYSYWLWTPKTGKWINPKTAVKPSPKEQFDLAMDFFNQNKFEHAKREFKKLIKAYPKTSEAAESQYYIGRSEESEDNLYEAYLAYQKVIDKYPFSERIQEIIEREYKIAEMFIRGQKRKSLGVPLPIENPAIEILTKIIDSSTYGPLASKAQYKLGLLLAGLMRYYEAEDAFNKVISNYPDSEWVEPAKFQIASCRAALSRGVDYDQGAASEAKKKFEEFVREYPEAVLSKKAEKSIGELRFKEAQSSYNAARFYEKQNKYKAAKIYYNDVINNYPDSPWQAKAKERLQIIETLEKKK